METEAFVALTAAIVSAHVSNNHVTSQELPTLIRGVFDALTATATPAPAEAEPLVPAVSIRASVKPDSLVCLECGRKFTTLKRHLRDHHDLSTDDYKARWKLDASYPLTAPGYSAKRKALALKIGLGRRAKAPVPPVIDEAPEPPTAKRTRGRPAKKKAMPVAASAELG